ncbi:hypothetical protein CPC08DRAFT_446017 [Agrocybe pediades]|nr:hypothetical protein CPC08DRAFT_446017 [Agrocybe pediades]
MHIMIGSDFGGECAGASASSWKTWVRFWVFSCWSLVLFVFLLILVIFFVSFLSCFHPRLVVFLFHFYSSFLLSHCSFLLHTGTAVLLASIFDIRLACDARRDRYSFSSFHLLGGLASCVVSLPSLFFLFCISLFLYILCAPQEALCSLSWPHSLFPFSFSVAIYSTLSSGLL